jgi:hypothetical protein
MLVSFLPVVSLSVGSASHFTEEKDNRGKTQKVEHKKFYFVVFSRSDLDCFYILESDTTNPVIPNGDGLKSLPKVSLKGLQNWDVALPVNVVSKVNQFLSEPLTQIDGISAYTLLNSGMITSETFLKVARNCLTPLLDDTQTVSNDQVMTAVKQTAAGMVGLTSDNTTLGAKIRGLLASSIVKEANKPVLSDPASGNTIDVQSIPSGNNTQSPRK